MINNIRNLEGLHSIKIRYRLNSADDFDLYVFNYTYYDYLKQVEVHQGYRMRYSNNSVVVRGVFTEDQVSEIENIISKLRLNPIIHYNKCKESCLMISYHGRYWDGVSEIKAFEIPFDANLMVQNNNIFKILSNTVEDFIKSSEFSKINIYEKLGVSDTNNIDYYSYRISKTLSNIIDISSPFETDMTLQNNIRSLDNLQRRWGISDQLLRNIRTFTIQRFDSVDCENETNLIGLEDLEYLNELKESLRKLYEFKGYIQYMISSVTGDLLYSLKTNSSYEIDEETDLDNTVNLDNMFSVKGYVVSLINKGNHKSPVFNSLVKVIQDYECSNEDLKTVILKQ